MPPPVAPGSLSPAAAALGAPLRVKGVGWEAWVWCVDACCAAAAANLTRPNQPQGPHVTRTQQTKASPPRTFPVLD
jgi:hypothetical protein